MKKVQVLYQSHTRIWSESCSSPRLCALPVSQIPITVTAESMFRWPMSLSMPAISQTTEPWRSFKLPWIGSLRCLTKLMQLSQVRSTISEKISLGKAESPAGPPPLLNHSLIHLRPGNHDLGLDRSHPKYLQEGVEIFTSDKAKECGIHYLDREVKTVSYTRRRGHLGDATRLLKND
jgi:hypothetical protein